MQPARVVSARTTKAGVDGCAHQSPGKFLPPIVKATLSEKLLSPRLLGFAFVTNHLLGFDDGVDPRRQRVLDALYQTLL